MVMMVDSESNNLTMCQMCSVLRGLLKSSRAFLCYQKRFVVCSHLCLFLVFVLENLDDFPHVKISPNQDEIKQVQAPDQ